MTIFARVRDGFTVVLDGIVYEAGAVLRMAEGVFGLHSHKLEVIPAEEAADLPIANAPAAAQPVQEQGGEKTPAEAGEKAGANGGASSQTEPAASAGDGATAPADAPKANATGDAK